MTKHANAIPFFGAPCILKPRAPKTTRSCCGEPYIHRADLFFDDDHNKRARVGEKLDLDAMIQAALPTCDISAIVARAKMGDTSVLNVNPGFTGDAVSLPKDLYDYKAMNDLYDKATAKFNELPAEVKALFNNKVDDYLNSILQAKADSIIEAYEASKNNPQPSEEGGNQ